MGGRWFLGSMAVVASLAGILVAGPVHAGSGGGSTRVFLIERGPIRVAAVVAEGVFLFNDRLDLHRFYRYSALKEGRPERFFVVDLNGDGKTEFLGLGKPTFGLDPDGNPSWDFPSGCTDLATGNIAGDPALEIACVHDGGQVTVLTFDGQLVWDFNLKGKRIDSLGLGDLDGDGNLDVEFAVKGWDTFVRLRSDGQEVGREFPQRGAPPAAVPVPSAVPVGLDALDEKATYDLDGDGTPAEAVRLAGATLYFVAKGSGKTLGELAVPGGGEDVHLAVGDANGDGRDEVVLGVPGQILFLRGDGQVLKAHRLDPARARRVPAVEVVGVHGVGLEEGSAPKLHEMFAANKNALLGCYRDRMSRYPLTRLGKALFKFDVDAKGKVTSWEKAYTTLGDEIVEKCVGGLVKKWTFPGAAGEGAYVTADLVFTWQDFLE